LEAGTGSVIVVVNYTHYVCIDFLSAVHYVVAEMKRFCAMYTKLFFTNDRTIANQQSRVCAVMRVHSWYLWSSCNIACVWCLRL